jgi:hypothetical protein
VKLIGNLHLHLVDEVGGKTVKSGRNGHEKIALSYFASEHLFCCSLLSIKGLFGASEFSPEWEQVYQIMVGEY